MAAAIHHVSDSDRTRANTWPEVNRRIDRETESRLRAATAEPDHLDDRVGSLDREWDFDRVLEAESAAAALIGLALAAAVDKRFLVIPGFAAAMIFVHAIQGWYPLLPLFRRLGLRTREEIDRERYALKALRGDFSVLSNTQGTERAAAAWNAVLA